MQNRNQEFASIDVQRLNIVEEDGTVKMMLFNSDTIPPGIMNGEEILPGYREGLNLSGIIFCKGRGR